MPGSPASLAHAPTQVTAESKFVDLGADSLDTVREPARLRPPTFPRPGPSFLGPCSRVGIQLGGFLR